MYYGVYETKLVNFKTQKQTKNTFTVRKQVIVYYYVRLEQKMAEGELNQYSDEEEQGNTDEFEDDEDLNIESEKEDCVKQNAWRLGLLP